MFREISLIWEFQVNELSISSLWTVAAIVLGFQLAALSWRINREVDMESEGEPTWVTLTDGIVFLSVLILVGGVFLAPILADVSVKIAAMWLGLSLILFVSAPIVLAGHYNLLLDHEGPRDRITAQEKWALIVPVLLIVCYGVLWGIL